KRGTILDPAHADSGSLLERVRASDPDERMPPEGAPLSKDQIDTLRRWIAAGAPSPADETPERDPRDHWAFRPVVRPAIPSPPDPEWPKNPIDAFVAVDHARHDLCPAPDAPRDVLLRRLSLDLIGLPPSREELRAFLDDPAPDAYERAVERLLASPHYGERWARHWMDVWRYADWYGRRGVPDVWNSAPQIWRWRDWIVRSLNADKGYDRMILEMLAADEVAPENDDDAVATGFLVRSWYALNPNQWRRDIVEHTGKAFLGLTFNCAHCHDHKYDPISHLDYFRFRAFFEPLGLRQDWVRGEPDPGPFQRYDYSTLRKIVRHGSVRVLDEDLEAKTFVYLRGDERAFPPDKPTVDPGVPEFLRFADVTVREVALPSTAHYPGTKTWIRETVRSEASNHLAAARQAFADADAQLRKAQASTQSVARALAPRLAAESAWIGASNRLVLAQAELTALEARLAADRARFADGAPPDAASLSAWASHAERFVALRKAEAQLADARQALALRETEQEIAQARRVGEGLSAKALQDAKAKDEEALAKARQQIAQLEQAASAANLALNSNDTRYASIGPSYPARSTGRRAALGRWIADGRNPLTARVAVNHVWSRHFHAPLVASVFDFGRNGATPTHPELLDWLAAELVDHGWSLKHLHRLLVCSRTYRQRSDPPADGRDPDNRFLARAHVGRLESEIVRDAMLAASGDLDRTVGGPVLPNTEAETSRRRSLYFETFPEAGGSDAFTGTFDPPDPNECYRRTRTILPQQALALTNSKFSHERSRSLADRLAVAVEDRLDPKSDARAAFVVAAYEAILSRAPKAAELATCIEFLATQEEAFRSPTPGDVPAAVTATATTTAAASGATGAPATPSTPPPSPPPGPDRRARASLVHALFSHNDFIAIR
ncbi:MAG: DUF1553 domain-containing protein, partial [Verrucomicrobiales bacterium]|nr:DUF1553 domain-containing protein [Verrucomicrobiales bacterium]